MELRRWGIILTVLGAVLWAFYVRTIKGYDEKDKVLKDWHKKARESGYVWPSETYIDKWLFWSGLFCVALGSLLQW